MGRPKKGEYTIAQSARDFVESWNPLSGKSFRGADIDFAIRHRFSKETGYRFNGLDSTTLRAFRHAKENLNKMNHIKALLYASRENQIPREIGYRDTNGKVFYWVLECIDREKSLFAWVVKEA